MALVPKDLLEQIADLEKSFTVPAEKLRTIVERFAKELDKGNRLGGSANERIICAWGEHCTSQLFVKINAAYASCVGIGIR
jgi:hypothetical protein